MENNVQSEDFKTLNEIRIMTKNGLTKLVDPILVETALKQVADSIPDDIVVNRDNLPQSREKLSEIRSYRYTLSNISKENQAKFNDLKRENKQELDDLIEIIVPKEKLLFDRIKQVEDQKKADLQAKKDAEINRVSRIKEAINNATNSITRAAADCSTEQDLELLRIKVSGLDQEWIETLEEYEYAGLNLQDQAKEYLAQAITNVETKQELKRLQGLADERKIKEAEDEKQRLIDSAKENEQRLAEIEAERKKTKEAEDKVEAILKQQGDDLKAVREREQLQKDLDVMNDQLQKEWDHGKKIGAKVFKRPKLFTDLDLATNRRKGIVEAISLRSEVIKSEKHDTALKSINHDIKDHLKTASESVGEILKVIDNIHSNSDTGRLAFEFADEIANGLIELDDYVNGK